MAQTCRANYRRRIEYADYEQRRRDSKSVLDGLNTFRRDIAVANFRLWNVIKYTSFGLIFMQFSNSKSIKLKIAITHTTMLLTKY